MKEKSNLKGKGKRERRIKKGRKYRKLGGGIYIHLQQNGPVFRLAVPFVQPTVISFPSKTRSEHSSSPPSVYLGKFFLRILGEKKKKKKIGKTFLSFRFFSSSFPPSPSSFYFSFLSNELKNSPLSRFPTEPMSNKGEKDSDNNSVLASRQRCSSRVYSTCHSRFAVTIVICNGNPSHILPIVAKTLVPLSLFLSLSCTPLAKPTSTVSIPLYSTTVPSFILLRFPRVRDPPMFQYGFF